MPSKPLVFPGFLCVRQGQTIPDNFGGFPWQNRTTKERKERNPEVPVPLAEGPESHPIMPRSQNCRETIFGAHFSEENGVCGRGCDEAEISEEKRLFTE